MVAHLLTETYSVLTRVPLPAQLTPEDALAAIRAFIAASQSVVALPADDILTLLESAAMSGVSGGRIHDLEIAATAMAATADVILTFNVRHFASGIGIDVIEPGSMQRV